MSFYVACSVRCFCLLGTWRTTLGSIKIEHFVFLSSGLSLKTAGCWASMSLPTLSLLSIPYLLINFLRWSHSLSSCWWSPAETSLCQRPLGTAVGNCRRSPGGSCGKTQVCPCEGCRWTSLWAAWTPSVGTRCLVDVFHYCEYIQTEDLDLPCPVFHQRLRSCLDCVAGPGRPSPGVSGPFDPLSTTADLRMT